MSAKESKDGGMTSMEDTIDRMISSTTLMNASSSSSSSAASMRPGDGAAEEFIRSPKWSGSKLGYYFGTTKERGTGYYLDQSKSGGDGLNKKRSREETSKDGQSKTSRQRLVHFNEEQNETLEIPPPNSTTTTATATTRIQKTGEELLEEAERHLSEASSSSSSSSSIGAVRIMSHVNLQGLKESTSKLSKCIQKNELDRAQYPNDASKFMNSELALFDEINALKSVAVNISLYPHLIHLNTLSMLFTLLSHDNTDIAMAVLSLFNEWLDPALLITHENISDNQIDDNDDTSRRQQLGRLGRAFIHNGIIDSITANLGRFDQHISEEKLGLDDALTLIESLLDLDNLGLLQLAANHHHDDGSQQHHNKLHALSSVAQAILGGTTSTTLLSWLLQCIHDHNNHQKNKHAAAGQDTSTNDEPNTRQLRIRSSEILAALMQQEDSYKWASNLSTIMPYTSPFWDDQNPPSQQSSKHNSNSFDGMEILLQAIAIYRKKDPPTDEECEYLENIFDALAASLFSLSNHSAFLEAQGLELMLRCIRERVHAGGGSMKVLNFALSPSSSSSSSAHDKKPSPIPIENDNHNSKGQNNNTTTASSSSPQLSSLSLAKQACETFVDAGGLKVLFPIFMGRPSSIPNPAQCTDASLLSTTKKGNDNKRNATTTTKRAKRALQARKEWWNSMESNAIQIVHALVRQLTDESPFDAKARLLVKFLEADCEKCDRIVELCLKYDQRMRLAEYQYYRGDEAEILAAQQENNDNDDDDVVELGALHAKLRGGGDIYHKLCVIAAFVSMHSKRCHAHIVEQLRLKNTGIGFIKNGLQEYHDLMDDGDQKEQLKLFMSSL